ncbi:hypothetical protein [Kitasatospora sp. NPDC088346]|uniref:hypothetical protein n=1 Tax=Kitasatospora sp. NPDC088346 TaxID=3364073 RepID=UPI0037F3649D
MTSDELHPGEPSIVVDCVGLSLEAVIGAAVRAAATAAPGRAPLLLDRVDLAGPLASSTDHGRVVAWAQRAAAGVVGRPVLTRTAAGAGGPSDDVRGGPEIPGSRESLFLAAAGALELERSPLEVWRAFAQALTAAPVTAEELTRFAGARPDLLLDAEGLGFVSRGARREVRDRFPLTAGQQVAVHRELLELRPEGTVAAYRRAARPVHAALAGELERWLTDPDFLVESDWYGLGVGLALAFPDGVPLGGPAGDLHCLLLQGVAAPASHEEWLSWVHHSLVSRGLTDAAEAVASRVRLPWRTVWSRWQWPSGLAPRTAGELLGEDLRAVRWQDTLAVATRREDEGDYDVLLEQVWDLGTGELLSAESTSLQDEVSVTSDDLTGRTAMHVQGAWSTNASSRESRPVPELPWVVEAVERAVQCSPSGGPDGTLWVLLGTCGLFAAVVDDRAVTALPQVPRGWVGHGVTPKAAWPPPALSLTGEATREELEQDWAFGAGACRPQAPGRLPAELRDPASRAFLEQVGWPVTEDLQGLSTADLSVDGLSPAPDGSGLLEGLGELWGVPVLLDGRTGEVRYGDPDPDGGPGPVMAGSLARFLRIVLLHHAALTAPVLLGPYDADDLEADVERWLAAVDPPATESGFWEHRFFVPSLIEAREGWDE